MFPTVNFAGTALLRPSDDVERRVYERIKGGVFARFKPGRYSDRNSVNEVVQHIYALYTTILDEHLAKVDTWDFAGLLCHQYDLYAQAESAYKKGEMNADEEILWTHYAGHSRRGIKYLLELTCQRAQDAEPVTVSMNDQVDAIQMLFVAAEELVNTYIRSDHYITTSDQVELTLDPEKDVYFSVTSDLDGPRFDPREDLRDASKYIPEPPFERNAPAHDQTIGDAFHQALGARYASILGTLHGLIEWPNQFDPNDRVGVLGKSEAIALLLRALPVDETQAGRILAGFSLTAQDMKKEGRTLYRPKQEYRARRRAFFVFPSPVDGQPLLVYSRAMAVECLAMLAIEMSYRHVAPEWNAPAIRESLDRLNLRSGKWFEETVARNLERLGIKVVRSVKDLVFKDKRRIRVPPAVGEIDLLGYSHRDRLLIVIEAKQVMFSTEPKMFLKDLQKFIIDTPSYTSKFMAKYQWVIDNADEVRQFLEKEFGHLVEIDGVGYAMVTHHPLSVTSRMTAFSCVNLAQFMRAYEAECKWTLSATSLPQELAS